MEFGGHLLSQRCGRQSCLEKIRGCLGFILECSRICLDKKYLFEESRVFVLLEQSRKHKHVSKIIIRVSESVPGLHISEFVPSAFRANLYQVHSMQICAGCTVWKFVPGALIKNLCQVHSIQICARCTLCKFVPGALHTNLCQVHSIQICARCTP